MPGHKTTHTQMERYQLIDSLLADGKIVPFDDILASLRSELRETKLSESSVRRDIRYMRDELFAPLAYDEKNHGWKYTKPFHFPVQSFSESPFTSLCRVFPTTRFFPCTLCENCSPSTQATMFCTNPSTRSCRKSRQN